MSEPISDYFSRGKSLPQEPLGQDIDSISWKRVSERYFKLRIVQRLVWTVILVALFALPLVGNMLWGWGIPEWLCWTLVLLMLIWQISLFILVPRQVRSWGYAEFDQHILITRGLLSRTTTAVPYGRMQLVDVTSGPLENMLNLASVELKTASAGTNAVIHGLELNEANRLRDVLTARGEEQMVKM